MKFRRRDFPLTRTAEMSLHSLWPTVVSLITDADRSAGTVAVSTAEPWAGFTNINMIYCPALALSTPLLLDPAKLSSSKRKLNKTQQIRKVFQVAAEEIVPAICRYVLTTFFLVTMEIRHSYPEETWSGSWTVTLVHFELFTGL